MSSRTRLAIVGAALLLATAAAFLPVARNDFIFYDDRAYITANPAVREGLTAPGLAWALTATRAGNWHPLTWAAHMLDVELFGLAPAGHHLSSLALHAANAVLLLLLLRALGGALAPAALAAALFALHPLRVESVAWAAEKKDLLAGLLWFLTCAAWLRYARRPGAGRYAAVLLLFALGLAAKPMLVTLPLVLLLLDGWPLGRAPWPRGTAAPGAAPWRRLLAEKAPLLALAAAGSAATLHAQRAAGAVQDLDLVPLALRLANAPRAAAAYLGRTLWPVDLGLLYPYRGPGVPVAETALACLLLAAATGLVLAAARRRPWLTAGWLWYLVTLLPVIGIVQVGYQARADRYTYLPLVGPVAALAVEACRRAGTPRRRAALAAAALAALACLAPLTRRQIGRWRDGASIFAHTAAATGGHWLPTHFLGVALRRAGDPAEAIAPLRAAVEAKPSFAAGWHELGLALGETGAVAESAAAFERSVRLAPGNPQARHNLAFALARLGENDAALREYRAALALRPDYAAARRNYALLLAALGRGEESAKQLRLAEAGEAEAPVR